VRRQNLADIFTAAADVALLMFAQASSFRFEWEGRRVQDGGTGRGTTVVVVVTPGFVKVADENARVLERPQVMLKPVGVGV
jgi:hypothetical protein